MDEYLKLCQACDRRSSAKDFRYFMGKRVCMHCADFLEMGDSYRPQPVQGEGSRQRAQYRRAEPPARWSERKGNRVPAWLGTGKARPDAQRERNRGKPDVMDAKVPKRRSEATPMDG